MGHQLEVGTKTNQGTTEETWDTKNVEKKLSNPNRNKEKHIKQPTQSLWNSCFSLFPLSFPRMSFLTLS